MTAGVATGTNSFVSSERNMVNPASRPIGAGVLARGAVEMSGRGSWKKQTPFGNRTDRSCNITPLCKQADFQPVVRDEKTRRTFTGGNRK
jgi:hypothetical protein